jgi:hypothetical protein
MAGNNLNNFISSYNNIIVDHEKKKKIIFENINEKSEKKRLQLRANWRLTAGFNASYLKLDQNRDQNLNWECF